MKNNVKKHRWTLIAAGVLAVLSLLCFLSWRRLSGLLDSQKGAELWRGEDEMEFCQVSAFMPVDEKLTLTQIYTFRSDMNKKFHEAALDVDNENQLFCDAWCGFGKVKAANGKRSGEVYATAVDGDYFRLHPIKLISGSYLTQDDLMKDRVLLDEDTAWLLFGGTELSGMSFTIEGQPFVVAGVIEREDDKFSKRAYTGGMGIYMSYEAFMSLAAADIEAAVEDSVKDLVGDDTEDYTSTASQAAVADMKGISCYEAVMPQPVKGYAYSVMSEKFPIGGGQIVDNTDRYEFFTLLKMVKSLPSRSMHGSGIMYPYWENAARGTEDRCMLLLIAGLALAMAPVALLIVLAARYGKLGKERLSEDLLPTWREKAQEAVRIRQRRRWERQHGITDGSEKKE